MRYALITGASSGIGKEFAIKLAEKGYNLLLIGRRKEKLEELQKYLLEKSAIYIELIIGDLKEENTINEILKRTENKEIKYLINNAGFGNTLGFFEGELQDSLDMVEVHINGLIRLCKDIAPRMKDGYIINVSSLAAYLPTAYNQIYSATKSFIITFSESLNFRLKNNGIRVKVLCPGFTYTDFHRNFYRISNAKCSWKWMEPGNVVENCLKNLNGKNIIMVPGILNKIVYLFAKHIPKRILYLFLKAQKEL